MTVEVDEAQVQPALQSAAKRLSKNYRIPGFRPGKAPYATIVRYLGEDTVYREALEGLTQTVYAAALEQEKVEPYAPGALEDAQLKPMVLTYSVPLRPEVDLGDYRALRVPYTAPEITDEAVNDSMEQWRETRAVIEPVERPAALGDVLVLDVNAFLGTGENPSDFLLADKDVELQLDEKADWPLPGFATAAVGLTLGENKKFDLTIPDDYANTSLRGQVAHVEVATKEIKSRTLPEWSDELAKEVGDYASLDDMRAKVREGLQRQASRETDREYADSVMEKLLEQMTLKYPPTLLDRELDGMLEELDRRLKEQRLTLDDYLKIEGKTLDSLRDEYKPMAEKRLKRSLALGKIIELEQLKVEEADIEQQLDQLAAVFGQGIQGEGVDAAANAAAFRQSFGTPEIRSSLMIDLISNRAVERIVALAKGEDIPLPPPAPTEAAATETLAPPAEMLATPTPALEAE